MSDWKPIKELRDVDYALHDAAFLVWNLTEQPFESFTEFRMHLRAIFKLGAGYGAFTESTEEKGVWWGSIAGEGFRLNRGMLAAICKTCRSLGATHLAFDCDNAKVAKLCRTIGFQNIGGQIYSVKLE